MLKTQYSCNNKKKYWKTRT